MTILSETFITKPNKFQEVLMGDSLETFCEAIRSCDNFVLASHVLPEGDAIGSVLAIDSLLTRLGKKTTVVCEDPVPDRLSFFRHENWHLAKELDSAAVFDALVVADCPAIERIGRVMRFVKPETKIFNIDHHVSNVRFGHYNYIRPEASACGEVVYEMFRHFALPITQPEAVALYVSIATDTGSFKYSNTTVRSHEIAAELIKTGINIEEINDLLHGTYSLEKIQLYSVLFDRIQTSGDGKVAWSSVLKADLKKTGGTYEDTEGFIDFLRYIKNVEIAFFMTELEGSDRENVRISFRSKGDLDVSQIAVDFGGGGHKKAAGCTVFGSIQDVSQKVLERIERDLSHT